jgi:hypothetical protein
MENVIPLVSDFSRILGVIDFFLGEILGLFGEWETETPGFLDVILGMLNPMERLTKAAKAIADAFEDAMNAFIRFRDSGGFDTSKINANAGLGGQGRAVGGPVSANRTYTVGERGPELFTPGAGGFITPNNRLGGGGSTNITINVNAGMGADGARLGEEIVRAIKKYERVSGPVFASA